MTWCSYYDVYSFVVATEKNRIFDVAFCTVYEALLLLLFFFLNFLTSRRLTVRQVQVFLQLLHLNTGTLYGTIFAAFCCTRALRTDGECGDTPKNPRPPFRCIILVKTMCCRLVFSGGNNNTLPPSCT